MPLHRKSSKLVKATSVPGDLHNEGPGNLQQDDSITERIPKRKPSRVRKLSQRISTSFNHRFSFLATREDDTPTKERRRRKKVGEEKNHRKARLGRVFSMENFNDAALDSKQPLMSGRSQSTSQQDLSSRKDHLRRVYSVPAATPPDTPLKSPNSGQSAPYGKIDQYQKLERLGEGSYATVFKGISRVNNMFVALKEIRLQEEEGIPFTAIREASLLKELKHANIVRLHDIIPSKEHLVLVFEYLHTDLCQFLEERPFGVHPHNSKLLLFQLLRGLAFVHARKILHRDIKPQNLLLSKRGELKLADFGLARAKSVPSRTYTHEVVTLWYRPPDVLLGSKDYTTSLDIWGAGCIFVELISGFPLFPGVKSPRDQLKKIFKVCGTPTESTWSNVTTNYDYDPEEFFMYPKTSICHQAPRLKVIPNGEEIAERMLQLNPKDRISAADAMKHPFFEDLPIKIHSLPESASIMSVKGIKMCEDTTRPESAKPAVALESEFSHYV